MRQQHYYNQLLRYARKASFHESEAEDLLQSALLAALEAGRNDIGCVQNRRWLIGILRNQAAFAARSSVRRRNRETAVTFGDEESLDDTPSTVNFIRSLPRSLKSAALLALTGHTKQEICWLLGISDAALRQRIVQLKRRWGVFDGRQVLELKGLKEGLAFGQIRRALLDLPCRNQAVLASHDPDGHLFLLTKSQVSAT
ncbi:MAG: sigma factor [Pseudomonadales bacterium]